MPVRSLNSSVLRWPDAGAIDQAVRRWAQKTGWTHVNICRIGYFGSYARGDWGVGSDLDIVIILSHTSVPYLERSRLWDTSDLPVPSDVVVYTKAEWDVMVKENRRLIRTLNDEAMWVYESIQKDHIYE